MKILLLNTLYPPSQVGGAERSLEVLSRGLSNSACNITVICLTDGADVTECRDGVTVHRLAHGNLYWPYDGVRHTMLSRIGWHAQDAGAFKRQAKVAQILDETAPDIVHTNNLTGFGSQIIPLVKSRGMPVLHTLRDFGLLCSRSSLFKNLHDCDSHCLSCRMLTARKRSAASAIDLVVGNSEYMIDRHREMGLFHDVPSRVIYNAVPGILDRRPDVTSQSVGATLHLGYAGAIKPEKGVEVLLEAMRRIGLGNWRLSIAGTGDEEYVSSLKRDHADLPIDWLGFVPVEPFLDQIDLMVIPSIWPEPMPRTLIEAMSHWLPTIVSDAGGSPEVAAMYPNAKVYHRRDVQALADMLASAIAAPSARRAVDKSTLQTFSVERLVENYLAAYRETIAIYRRGGDHHG
ncbi:MAG: glycosyltransferase family 4 protein [Erythrobacter sp.]